VRRLDESVARVVQIAADVGDPASVDNDDERAETLADAIEEWIELNGPEGNVA
jgi:hypothetical protein